MKQCTVSKNFSSPPLTTTTNAYDRVHQTYREKKTAATTGDTAIGRQETIPTSSNCLTIS